MFLAIIGSSLGGDFHGGGSAKVDSSWTFRGRLMG